MKSTSKNLPTHLICFSHLRWDFVFQRPQHILTRFARESTVYYFEEPVFDTISESFLTLKKRANNITTAVPHLTMSLSGKQIVSELQSLLDSFFIGFDLTNWIFWYYTPMAYSFTAKYKPKFIVYDCMDELSAFDFAPPELIPLEKALLNKADLVFTGGSSLYEVKKKYHDNIFAFPSSIDHQHFAQAKTLKASPDDQAKIVGPKIGFFGVIDERFDIELIKNIAERRPNWQLVIIGPVVKISQEILPKNKNIHYLGQKDYEQLPAYLSEWKVALIPFYLNKSTEFISPTKTPEYLTAGIPVVSTAIKDVVDPYGVKGLVQIATDANDFIIAIEKVLNRPIDRKWEEKIASFLKNISWDNTYASMKHKVEITLKRLKEVSIAS